jgi:cobalt-zinc-cadmium efflux system membrane fusion protein
MAKRPAFGLSPLSQSLIVLALAGLVLLAIFVVLPILSAGRGNLAASATATPAPVPSGYFKPTAEEWNGLTIAPVREMPFPALSESQGTIAAADDTTTQVFSPYTGRVTAVYPTVGDTVVKGAPLFAIDGVEYAQAQSDIATAEQTLAAARVQLHVTAVNRRHLLALLAAGGAAAKDVAQSTADVSAAQVAVKNDETAVALVRSRLRVLGFGDAEIDRIAKGDPRSRIPTSIVVPSPITGIVTQRAVGVGQNVESAAAGASNALFTVTDLSRVFLVAAVPETSIAAVHVGDPVSVKMLAFPDRTFAANVTYIAPMVDAATHRIMVRAAVSNPDLALKLGMFGSMTIRTGTGVSHPGVPEEAVIFEGDSARVWITGPNHTLALREIRVAPTVDGIVPVLAGVSAGDHVVTTGSIFIDRAASGGN